MFKVRFGIPFIEMSLNPVIKQLSIKQYINESNWGKSELEESNKSLLSLHISVVQYFSHVLSFPAPKKWQPNFACFCFKVQILSLHIIPFQECSLFINSFVKALTYFIS